MQQLSCTVLANMFAAEALQLVPDKQSRTEYTWVQAVEEYGNAEFRSRAGSSNENVRRAQGHDGPLTSPRPP